MIIVYTEKLLETTQQNLENIFLTLKNHQVGQKNPIQENLIEVLVIIIEQ